MIGRRVALTDPETYLIDDGTFLLLLQEKRDCSPVNPLKVASQQDQAIARKGRGGREFLPELRLLQDRGAGRECQSISTLSTNRVERVQMFQD